MPKFMSMTFLGTSSGGGPTLARACSSACLSLDGTLWLVDCAEGTQMQMQRARLRLGRLNKIFITHLHVDHCMGIVPLLASAMYGGSPQPEAEMNRLRMELYGPSGLRRLVRTTLQITQATLAGKYAVHELLRPGDTPYPCTPGEMHANEAFGRDIWSASDGVWREFETAQGMTVDAGPIVHRVSCLGYVFTEPPRAEPLSDALHLEPIDRNQEALIAQGHLIPRTLLGKLLKTRESITLPDGYVLHPPPFSIPGRKVVVLGDTSDPSALRELAMDPSLLVHEATNAHIPSPEESEAEGDAEREKLRLKAISRGHSTSTMAGAFAKEIRARRLALNHLGSKFAPGFLPTRPNSPTYPTRFKAYEENMRTMQCIEDQASAAWEMGRAIATRDLLIIEIDGHEVGPVPTETQGEEARAE
ncbi:hypothetical protein BOTBODRAFT_35151 [Botryobasidium botryosum FD-172 SS1]|uniref:Uncharacterized protein n=1 Tax=Botryobasidium botryosum (strain FD-172 SS1) TaxID=930990 RepID=A0A067MIK5_BOTB1|nr:hypothetical protein BOTBODRAFT_35151 [Botryobasidium botryosum FD-172 SS1]